MISIHAVALKPLEILPPLFLKFFSQLLAVSVLFLWHRDTQRQYLYSYTKPIASTGLAKHLMLANKACPREIPLLTPVKYYSLFRSLKFTGNHQTKNDGCRRQQFAGDYGCTMASQLFWATCPAYLMLWL